MQFTSKTTLDTLFTLHRKCIGCNGRVGINQSINQPINCSINQ